MSIKAALFDHDGTLTVPPDGLWLHANNIKLQQYGGRMVEMDEFAKVLRFGTDLEAMLRHLGISPDLAIQIEHERNAYYNLLLADHAEPLPGAHELLREVRSNGRRTGILTHARHTNLQVQRQRTGFDGLIDVVIAKDDMELPTGEKRYKPDAYCIEEAARRLGVGIDECVVVGDLRSDMQTAKNAGVPGILIPGPHTTTEAHDIATRVYQSLTECREKMGEWLLESHS